MRKVWILFSLLAFATSVAVAQSNLSSLIVGTWRDTSLAGIDLDDDDFSVSTNLNEMGKSIKSFSKYLHYYLFRADGTGESIFVYPDMTTSYEFTWIVLYDEHRTSKKDKEYYVQVTSSDKQPSVQKFYLSKFNNKSYIVFSYNKATLIADISKWEKAEIEDENQDEANVF